MVAFAFFATQAFVYVLGAGMTCAHTIPLGHWDIGGWAQTGVYSLVQPVIHGEVVVKYSLHTAFQGFSHHIMVQAISHPTA